MPGSTPNGYPYPLGTEPISQGDDAIKALATAVDRISGGEVGIVIAASTAGGQINVTFPVGQYAVPPLVFVTPRASANWWGYLSTPPTVSGATIGIASYQTRNAATIPTQWVAIPRG